ncbi:hypothetical protein PM03_11705 [Thalassobacter stenotrophicus]|nr:hypothetical protein PM03_11705 [Thalassobacter stenotrophicus]KGL03163.1 hypothetical protein PM04_03840 [Thalassobacter sp. 16PALIMAR09]
MTLVKSQTLDVPSPTGPDACGLGARKQPKGHRTPLWGPKEKQPNADVAVRVAVGIKSAAQA